jgi:3-oxoacyl-(acyl-carrier-protein) synthase
MLLAEGAAALVVGRAEENPRRRPSPREEVRLAVNAVPFTRRAQAGAALDAVLGALPVAGSQWIIGSANGTWTDSIEAAGLCRHLPGIPAWHPKAVLGDPLGAGALLQVAFGAMALARNETPGNGSTAESPQMPLRKLTITALGLNQQAGAAVLSNAVQ